MSDIAVTDRKIQDAREHARDIGNQSLADMLQQLLDYRATARKVIGAHDYRQPGHNGEMPYLDSLVGRSGCQWYTCDQLATTRRIRAESHSRGETAHLCCAHADAGEAKGIWLMDHEMTIEWHKRDHEMRAWRQQRNDE